MKQQLFSIRGTGMASSVGQRATLRLLVARTVWPPTVRGIGLIGARRKIGMPSTMRVAIGQLRELSHHDLTFARQLGASGIQLNTPTLPGEHRWEGADL